MKYRVFYSYKIIDKASSNYGVLQDSESRFESFCEAVAYARRISRGGYSSFQVIGTPTVAQING